MLTLCQVLPTTPHPCEKGFTHPTSEEESGLPHAAQLHGGQRSLCPALWGLQTGRHTASSGCCSKLLETEWLTTAGIYSYSSGGRKSEMQRGRAPSREDSAPHLSCFWWQPAFWARGCTTSTASCLLLCVSVLLPFVLF